MTRTTRITAPTKATGHVVDVTPTVAELVERSGVRDGRVTLSRGEPSCALAINEMESGLVKDLGRVIGSLGPTRAHVGAPSVTIPVHDRRMHLGNWQRLMLIELADGGERSVTVQIVGSV